jgi:hypothetical protein
VPLCMQTGGSEITPLSEEGEGCSGNSKSHFRNPFFAIDRSRRDDMRTAHRGPESVR